MPGRINPGNAKNAALSLPLNPAIKCAAMTIVMPLTMAFHARTIPRNALAGASSCPVLAMLDTFALGIALPFFPLEVPMLMFDLLAQECAMWLDWIEGGIRALCSWNGDLDR
jgi:hypothetical protein